MKSVQQKWMGMFVVASCSFLLAQEQAKRPQAPLRPEKLQVSPSAYHPDSLRQPVRWWHVLEHPPYDTAFWNHVDVSRILVAVHPGVSLRDLEPFRKQWGLSRLVDSSRVPNVFRFYAFEVPNPSPAKIFQMVEDAFLRWQDQIRGIEPFPIVRTTLCIPNDPAWTLPNSLRYHWGPWLIWADSAWCYVTGGSDQWIGVIDDAVDYHHEELSAYVRYGWDFADGDNDPHPPSPVDAHGTHVTGTVGALMNNQQGIAGMVNDTIIFAKVMPDAWSGTGSLSPSAIVNAISWLGQLPKVTAINMSLGTSTYSFSLDTACQSAYANGKLLIGASGNNGVNSISYPARFPTVVAVGSVDYNADNGTISLSNFSNYGPEQEVVAPGGYLISNGNIYQIISSVPEDSLYDWMSGTSMATPHVTGLAGLLFAVHPCMTNQIARQILQNTALDLGAPGKDDFYGYGLVQAHLAVIAALPLRVETVLVNHPCPGQNNGQIQIVLDSLWNGVDPLTIQWNDGVTGSLTRSGLAPGTYIVSIADATGCTWTDTFTLMASSSLSVQIDSMAPQCAGDSSGWIQVQPLQGRSPFQITWNTGDTTFFLDSLGGGTYIFTLTDACGQQLTDTIVLPVPPSIQIQAQVQHLSCAWSSDGSISLTVSGGTGPYSYQWNTGSTASSISGLSPGTYWVQVQDQNGCTSADTFQILAPDSLRVQENVSILGCVNDSLLSISLTITGGWQLYTVQWNTGDTGTLLSPVPYGTYSWTVTDSGGCMLSGTISPPPITPFEWTGPAQVQHPLCAGVPSGSISVSVQGGIPPYAYVWSNGMAGATVSGLDAGVYTVSVSDASGCVLTRTFTLEYQDSVMGMVVQVQPPSIPGGCDATVIVSAQGGQPPYSYTWNTGAIGDTLAGVCPGTYMCVIVDQQGCRDTLFVRVEDAITGFPESAYEPSSAEIPVQVFLHRDGNAFLVVSLKNIDQIPWLVEGFTADGKRLFQVVLMAGEWQTLSLSTTEGMILLRALPSVPVQNTPTGIWKTYTIW